MVEGAARAVLDGGGRWPVELVAAPGSGDDMLVEVAADANGTGDQVVVVTADRGLRVRLDEVGSGWVGPSWLLRRRGAGMTSVALGGRSITLCRYEEGRR